LSIVYFISSDPEVALHAALLILSHASSQYKI
jgi:hypothetical protein